jgi:hypothetical protein
MALGAKSAGITPFFKTMHFENVRESLKAGRPIYEDVEVCEIRIAGTKDSTVQPSHMISPSWEVDEDTGEQRQLTYAERFPRQYQQFKAKQQQTKSGTPLDYVPFLTDARRAELRAQNIYTIEALAELDGQPLKNLGIGGRDLKNKAVEYLASSSHDGTILRQQAQIEALQAQLRLLEDDRRLASSPPAPQLSGPREGPDPVPTPPEKEEPAPGEEEHDDNDGEGEDERLVAAGPNVSAELIGLSRDELRAYIVEKTGKRPVGNPSLRNLVRIAQELGR